MTYSGSTDDRKQDNLNRNLTQEHLRCLQSLRMFTLKWRRHDWTRVLRIDLDAFGTVITFEWYSIKGLVISQRKTDISNCFARNEREITIEKEYVWPRDYSQVQWFEAAHSTDKHLFPVEKPGVLSQGG